MQLGFKYLFLGFLLFAVFQVKGQFKPSAHALTYKFVVTDYNSLDPTYRENSDRFLHPDDINYAAEIGYFYSLSKEFKLGLPLRIGSIDAYHNLTDPNDSSCISIPCEKRYFRNEFFLSLDLMAVYALNNGYILREDFFLQPYFTLGLGGVYMDKRKGHFDLQLPVAAGCNIQLNPKFKIQTQLEFRAAFLTQKHNMAISLGFLWQLGQPEES